MKPHPDIEVFYDEGCPICRFEVKLYDRIDQSNRIRWTSIGGLTENDLPVGKSRDDLLGRFHVRSLTSTPSNDTAARWFIGVDAFARIWQVLPGFQHVAFLFSVPGVRQIAMAAYRLFLRWQRWHRAHRSEQSSSRLPRAACHQA